MDKVTASTQTILGAALIATLGLGQAARADSGATLFGVLDLDRGYLVAVNEGKCGEGKCGATGDDKTGEGKCGATGDDKTGEGKCGEGKCGSA